jgi:hypothetical protein
MSMTKTRLFRRWRWNKISYIVLSFQLFQASLFFASNAGAYPGQQVPKSLFEFWRCSQQTDSRYTEMASSIMKPTYAFRLQKCNLSSQRQTDMLFLGFRHFGNPDMNLIVPKRLQ